MTAEHAVRPGARAQRCSRTPHARRFLPFVPTPERMPELLAKAKRTKAQPIDFAFPMYYGRRTRYDIPSGGTEDAVGFVAFLRRSAVGHLKRRELISSLVRGPVTEEGRDYGRKRRRRNGTRADATANCRGPRSSAVTETHYRDALADGHLHLRQTQTKQLSQ